jgi:hypothetical protein
MDMRSEQNDKKVHRFCVLFQKSKIKFVWEQLQTSVTITARVSGSGMCQWTKSNISENRKITADATKRTPLPWSSSPCPCLRTELAGTTFHKQRKGPSVMWIATFCYTSSWVLKAVYQLIKPEISLKFITGFVTSSNMWHKYFPHRLSNDLSIQSLCIPL